MSALANLDVEVGIRHPETGFVPMLSDVCHLCARAIDRAARAPLGLLPCCLRVVHRECAAARFAPALGCPWCWADRIAWGTPDVFTMEFLETVHVFFLEGNWYHVFASGRVPLAPLREGAAAEFQRDLQAHAHAICTTLVEAGRLEAFIRATQFSTQTLDLFYAVLDEAPPTPRDTSVWRGLLRVSAEEPCRVGSTFNLVFSVLRGDITPSMLSGLTPEQLRNTGMAYPQLLQIGWKPGGPLRIPREKYAILDIPL